MKTIAKHARSAGRSAESRPAGIPQIWEHGTPAPAVAPGRVHGDPLTGPIAITERPVLGDQIRMPVVWCEIAPCIARYEDPVALGEADIRARAARAGWRHDAAGRLVCPACLQRSPDVWPSYPLVPRARTPAGEIRQHAGHARAGVTGRALASIASRAADFAADRRAMLRWLLPTSLTIDSWDAPRRPLVGTPAGRHAAGPSRLRAIPRLASRIPRRGGQHHTPSGPAAQLSASLSATAHLLSPVPPVPGSATQPRSAGPR